jgi:hypothetical protein
MARLWQDDGEIMMQAENTTSSRVHFKHVLGTSNLVQVRTKIGARFEVKQDFSATLQ